MMQRNAVLAFDDTCRLLLERVKWEPHLCFAGEPMREGEHREPPRTAAWLMCNPSTADAMADDTTANRVVKFSDAAGCWRSLIGNVWPYRTPYPDELWQAIGTGQVTPEMRRANLEMLAMIGGQADIHVAAFGVEPVSRYPRDVYDAIDAFTLGGHFPLYCLGTNSTGCPLHPVARGKFAVRTTDRLRPWSLPKRLDFALWSHDGNGINVLDYL